MPRRPGGFPAPAGRRTTAPACGSCWTGADTLNLVSSRREELARAADFLVAPQPVLDALNDKETVHRRAVELGLPVPRDYDEMPDRFPVVIKPHCGE